MNKLIIPYEWKVFLFGMMLAWKSGIWKMLAERLQITFEDLDDFLVQHLNIKDIWEYISTKLEEYRKAGNNEEECERKAWADFHKVENDCLKILLWTDESLLLSGWGRTAMSGENRLLINDTKWLIKINLEVDFDEQIRRAESLNPEQLLNRPALQWKTPDELKKIFRDMQLDRRWLYSHFWGWNTFNTWWKFSDVVEEIVELITEIQSETH